MYVKEIRKSVSGESMSWGFVRTSNCKGFILFFKMKNWDEWVNINKNEPIRALLQKLLTQNKYYSF